MTAKRYTIKPQDDLFGVVDNYSADKVCVINGIRTEIEAKWLCKDMNNLNDENERLKKENYELHKRLGDFKPFEEHIKERTSKTSINDIIGLVKTDEPTDIVELKKGIERMTECNAIIEANNEIDELKRENKELNELCVKYDFKVGRLEVIMRS